MVPHDLDNAKEQAWAPHGAAHRPRPERQPDQGAEDCRPENLNIQVTERGSKSWLMQWMANGKRCYLGLGRFPDVSLSDAKAKVTEAKAKFAKGEDPRRPI